MGLARLRRTNTREHSCCRQLFSTWKASFSWESGASTISSMTKRSCRSLVALVALLFFPLLVFADGANFDLDGPALLLRVTRDKQTLDIGEVPNLLSGDKLWIQPAFPSGQTVRYLADRQLPPRLHQSSARGMVHRGRNLERSGPPCRPYTHGSARRRTGAFDAGACDWR